jgi:phage gpG-like protein
MATLNIKISGEKRVSELMSRIDPSRKGEEWVRGAFIESALLTQKKAAKEKIIQGSRFRGPRGPRGGKGAIASAGVHPTKLTSRHGGSGLVGSIRVNRSPLPKSIEVGSDKAYAAIHEFGGSISISDKMRRVLHAKGIHPRASTTTIKMPARPFLNPGLEDASKSFEAIFVRNFNRVVRR